jgi:hypothetical protein
VPAKVVLNVIAGPIAGRRFVFDSHDTFLFGRHADCHAQLPHDALVSRHNFILEVNPPAARLRDLGSLNGTVVNGIKYGGRAPNESPEQGAQRRYCDVDLKDGDLIAVGSTKIRVEIVEPPRCRACGGDIEADDHPASNLEFCDRCRSTAALAARQEREMLRCSRCGAAVEPGAALTGFLCEECSFQMYVAVPAGSQAMALSAPAGSPESGPFQAPGYVIERVLGKGGMGVVYLARRTQGDGDQVALKRLLAQTAFDDQMRHRFRREMEVNFGLRHPNIVGFFESGSIGRQFYFVMEYCAAGNLFDRVRGAGGGVPLRDAEPLMLQCLEGLGHAHRQGYVHRDLKPSNLLLTEDSAGRTTLKISDFGLAKSFEGAGLSGLTATGERGGSWLYMPREQLTDFKYVQPTSDVWSIAATFYFLLSGHPPRDMPKGRDPIDVILRERCVPLGKRNSQLPRRLGEAIDAALASDPRQRFADADEFRRALEAVL